MGAEKEAGVRTEGAVQTISQCVRVISSHVDVPDGFAVVVVVVGMRGSARELDPPAIATMPKAEPAAIAYTLEELVSLLRHRPATALPVVVSRRTPTGFPLGCECGCGRPLDACLYARGSAP